MTGMTESADKDLKTAFIDMLKDLKDNMDTMKKETL